MVSERGLVVFDVLDWELIFLILLLEDRIGGTTKVVCGWIKGQIFSKNVKSVWDEFKETYDKIDGFVIYNLNYKFYSLTQSGSSLFEYYHNYNSLWRQFNSLVNLPSCSCDSATKLKDHGNLMRVESDKNNLVHTSSTGPSSSAFVSRPNNWSNTRYTQSKGPCINTNLVCKHCHMTGHTIDRCYELNGYPPGFKKINTRGNNVSKNASGNSIKSDQSAGNTLTFTPDQINRLMALIGSKSDSSELQSCVADKITLRDVLVVPRYKVSLISVDKLAKGDKFVVSFTESKCLVQDSLLKSLVGTGSEKNVLLSHPSDQVLSVLKDKIQIDSLDNIQPCDVCHKAKQTREPFPLSDHKTKCLVKKIDQAVNESDDPYDDKRDSSLGDSDGITKSLKCADVSTYTLPIVTSQPEEVVTKSPIRPSNSSPDDLGNSGASPKGDDATLYDDEYKSEGEDFVDFNHLFDSDQSNIPDIVCVVERKYFYSACMMCCRVGSII
ncbi:hypothetical protein Tco_0374798 [Tanacetum coccineum]